MRETTVIWPGQVVDFINGLSITELMAVERAVRARREVLETERRRAQQAELIEAANFDEAFDNTGSVGTFCEDLVFHARRLGKNVRGTFNEVSVEASPEATAHEIFEKWRSG